MTLQIVEKDFWVCWILKHLYSVPEFASHIIFKGGTSLSKAFGLIERFSEDCDLTIDKKVLGELKDPTEANISGKEQERRVEALVLAAQQYISNLLIPKLSDSIKQSMPSNVKWDLELTSDKQTILFHYPQFLDGIYEKSYIKPSIILELGARGGILPKENKVIKPHIAEAFPELLINSDLSIPTLSIERTFWEKITILHSLYHRHQKGKIIGLRMSRHYYDVFMLDKNKITETAINKKDILQEVIRNNMVFFKDSNSSYSTATFGNLKLLPSQEMTAELRKDYRAMEAMITGEFPLFDQILSSIEQLEIQLNRL